MKTAQNKAGGRLRASATAPAQAICPICGGTVLLRRRTRMNKAGMVYYWRHRPNRDMDCYARARPVR